MRRFIRYLYEYENGQRIRNVGFVKVEERDESTTLNIHGKGLRLNGDETLKLYIFYMDENVCRGIWQGDITNVNPALNYRLIFTEEDTGRPENFGRIEGIILELSDNRKFAAVWNDMEVDVNGMRLWDEEMMPEENEVEQVAPESLGVRLEKENNAENSQEENTPESEERPIGFVVEPEPEIDTYINPTKPQIQKIMRGDIARLPRCEWRLANNSFLVHGFHNYHHLIFMEDGDGFWLGVPGIFHAREAKAAEAFGFPRFLRVDDEDLNLADDEKEPMEEFGYWCRKVRRGPM